MSSDATNPSTSTQHSTGQPICPICGYALIYSGQCNCTNTTQQSFINNTITPSLTTHQSHIPFSPTTAFSSSPYPTNEPIQRFSTEVHNCIVTNGHGNHSNPYFAPDLLPSNQFLSSQITTPLFGSDFVVNEENSKQLEHAYKTVLTRIESELDRLHHQLVQLRAQYGNMINRDGDTVIGDAESEILIKIQILEKNSFIVQTELSSVINNNNTNNITNNVKDARLGGYKTPIGQNNSKKNQKKEQKTFFSSILDRLPQLSQFETETQRYIIGAVTLACYVGLFFVYNNGINFRSKSNNTNITAHSNDPNIVNNIDGVTIPTNKDDTSVILSIKNHQESSPTSNWAWLSGFWGTSNAHTNIGTNGDGIGDNIVNNNDNNNAVSTSQSLLSSYSSPLFPSTMSIWSYITPWMGSYNSNDSVGVDLDPLRDDINGINNDKSFSINNNNNNNDNDNNNLHYADDDSTRRIDLTQQTLLGTEQELDNVAGPTYDDVYDSLDDH